MVALCEQRVSQAPSAVTVPMSSLSRIWLQVWQHRAVAVSAGGELDGTDGGCGGVHERLFSATAGGLWVSDADARDWRPALPAQAPVSFLEVSAEGTLPAFVLGLGLLRRAEDADDRERLHPGF